MTTNPPPSGDLDESVKRRLRAGAQLCTLLLATYASFREPTQAAQTGYDTAAAAILQLSAQAQREHENVEKLSAYLRAIESSQFSSGDSVQVVPAAVTSAAPTGPPVYTLKRVAPKKVPPAASAPHVEAVVVALPAASSAVIPVVVLPPELPPAPPPAASSAFVPVKVPPTFGALESQK